MKVMSMVCPECGEELNGIRIDEEEDGIYCQHCGEFIDMEDIDEFAIAGESCSDARWPEEKERIRAARERAAESEIFFSRNKALLALGIAVAVFVLGILAAKYFEAGRPYILDFMEELCSVFGAMAIFAAWAWIRARKSYRNLHED